MKTMQNDSTGIKGNKGGYIIFRARFKSYWIILCLIIFFSAMSNPETFSQGVGISEISITPEPTSILELRSTLRGLLAPRMSTTQRNDISTPATGLLIYNTTTNAFNYFNGTEWIAILNIGTGVTSITGTVNRISISGTPTVPIIDISGTYAGQTSITTLGTIGAGTWNGTAVGINYGGTGQTTANGAFNALSPMTTLGDVIYGAASGGGTRLAGNTTTTPMYLKQTGNGTVSSAPVWGTLGKSDVGLGNVDNTTDLNKPISTLTQSSLNLKADLASPSFTGVPLSPTATAGNNSTQIATTAFVTGAVATGATPDATTLVKGKVQLAGDLTGTAASPTIAAGAIDNSKISASAGIVDSKLATISTVGKVSNSATTATNVNTPSTIVLRDISGNFSAGTITATLSGNASTATTSGNVTGTVAILNGGTGQTTAQAAINSLAGSVSSGLYLRGNGTNVVMSTIQAADVPTLNQNTTGTANIAGGTVGAIPYQTAANATGVLASTVTANKVLMSGSSAAPVWSTPTFPNSSATSRKIIISDGTNWIASTETYAVPGTSGNLLVSNGTNWTSALPIFNQNTTGSAAKWTTARNLAGNSVDGSGNVNFTNKFIVQGIADAGLTGAQFLGSLGTGLVKNTTTTGVLSIATSGTDYSAGTSALATGILKSTTATGALTIAVAGDFPALNQNTTGTAANVTGTVAIANGGTGQTTAQAAINSLAGSVSSGQYLRGNGTNILMSSIQAGDVPTLNQNTTGTATNVTGTVVIANGGTGATSKAAAFNALSPMTSQGDIIYGGAAGTGTRLAAGTANQVLAMNPAGTLPIWTTRGAGDMILADAQTVTGIKTFSVAPVFSTLTAGSIPFAGTSGVLSQDNTNLFWDDTNKRLSIGAGTNPTGKLEVEGDVHITATGSGRSDVGSPNPPREIGLTNWADGNGARFTFGDPWNALQNAYNYRMQITSYHGMEIVGNRRNSTSGIAFVLGNASDPSLSVIGTTPAAPVLAVIGDDTQSGNLQEWRNSAGTTLASVSSAGNISTTAGLTITGAAVNLNVSSNNNTNINTGTSTGAVTIGNSASDGVRIGNGRVIINKPLAPTIGVNTDIIATVSQILDSGIIGFNTSSARILTLPSAQGAAGLVQALPGTPAVGDTFTFLIFDIGSSNVTITAPDASITIVNTNTLRGTSTDTRVVYFRVTSVTAGSETISVY